MSDLAGQLARQGLPAHVRQLTPGAQPVLLVHCMLASSAAWGPLAAALRGADAALTAFDLPGHRQSPDWPSPAWPDPAASYHSLATRIATALTEALVAEAGPVDLVGHSFGATVALRVALERPDLVRTLALVEPVLFAAADPAARAAQAAAEAPFAAALAAGRAEAAAEAFLGQWGDGTPWQALPDGQRSRLTARIRLIDATAPALWEDAEGLLAPGRPEALDRPALLLDGAASPPVMAAICIALAARLPRARRHTVPGAAHMLPVTHPAPAATALRALWAAA